MSVTAIERTVQRPATLATGAIGKRDRERQRVAEWLIAALIVLLTLAAGAVVHTVPAADGALPLPEPMGPPPISAMFPEQSQIASCSVLANTSDALIAPRSARSSSIVGPIYLDACVA